MSAGSFSIGVIFGAAVASNFTSTISVTQRSLTKISDTTDKMKKRQMALTSAVRRYGDIGAGAARNMRNQYQMLNRSVRELERSQKKLIDTSNKSKMLREQRSALHGQVAGFATKATIAATPFIRAAKGYAADENQLTGIAQGRGDFSPAFKQHVLNQARKNSMETAQSTSDILSIVDTLTDAQWSQSDIDKVTTLIGRTATTYKQDASVFTETAETLAKTFGYTSDQMQHAFNLLAKGGNTVGFEMPDLVPALKDLGPLLEKSGLKGDEALKQVMAAAGAARKTLAKDDVLPGMKSWLDSIDSKRLAERYKTMGVEYENSRADYAKAGYSDFESSIIISQRYLEKKGGKGFAEKFAAMDGNVQGQQALINNFGLGQVFTSPEQIKFLNAMIKNMDTYKKNKDAISNGQDDNYINKNYAEHAKTLGVEMALLKNQVANTWSVMGEQLAPVMKENIQWISMIVKSTSAFISQNPVIVKSIFTVVKAIFLFSGSLLIFKIIRNYLATIKNFIGGISALGKTFIKLSKSGGNINKTGQLMAKLTKGGWSLAKVLSGGLVKGLMLAGRAVLFLGRAMLMNPVGLIITGIAVAAFLIYKYWQPISGFFKRLWTGVKTVSVAVWQGISRFFSGFFTVQVAGFKRIWGAVTGFFSELWSRVTSLFSGGIGSMAKVIINWLPVGLFHKCFAGVLGYFGVDLPASFTEFGKNLIHGLVDGITATFGKVKDTITSVADSVKDTFKGWLGINSPSTVFMGYGGNISEGLAIGIEGKKNIAASAIKSLHSEIEAPLPPKMGKIGVAAGRPGAAGGANTGDIHLTFSPVINLPGGARAEIRESLRACLPELEAVLRDILYQQQRRSFSAA